VDECPPPRRGGGAWLDRNRALFRLGSLAGIAVVGDNTLARTETHAVTLRRTPGGLAAVGGGGPSRSRTSAARSTRRGTAPPAQAPSSDQ
jgi:hypothetical protein